MTEWAWRIGMIILAGVPAIVGGGIVWAFFGNWTAVIIWEIVLLFLVSLVVSKGEKKELAEEVEPQEKVA